MLRDTENDLSNLLEERSNRAAEHNHGSQRHPQPAQQPADGAPQVQPQPSSWSQGQTSQAASQAATHDENASSHDGTSVWKILAILGAGCLGINLLVGTVALALLSVGLSSCVASCSDSPIGDSREDAAFIASLEANKRDLVVFDALSSSLEALCAHQAADDGEGALAAAELREQVASGSWPKDTGEALNPRVWVRLAELAQSWLEGETGEQWEVVDLSYPFPNNGPIPVPATRGENSSVETRLRCTQGADKGLVTTVRYYRWRSPATYEHSLEDDRERRAKIEGFYTQIDELGVFEGHTYLIGTSDVCVWETGEGDALRDPATFAAATTAVDQIVGPYVDVRLMVADAPVVVGYDTLSYDYPNNKPEQVLSLDEARARLAGEHNSLHLCFATDDVLLRGYMGSNDACTVDDLRGTLIPSDDTDYNATWHAPTAEQGAVFDEGLAQAVCEPLADADAQRCIALWAREDTSSGDAAYTTWVVLPRGAMPETREGFCAAVKSMFDVSWDYLDIDENAEASMHLYISVIDEGISDAQGQSVTFDELRDAAKADSTCLEGYEATVLLGGKPYASKWDNRRHDYRFAPHDMGGTLTRGRAWRFEGATDES